MNRSIVLAFGLLLVADTVYAQESGPGLSQTVDRGPQVTQEQPVEAAGPVDSAVERLTLRHRVAQLMIVTLGGTPVLDSQDRALLTKYPPGGVMLPSLLRPRSASAYVVSLRSLPIEKATGVPLLIGANMHALPKYGRGPARFFPPLPSLLSIAAADDVDTTNALASLVAEYMTTLGLNLHLGPCFALAPTLPKAKGSVQCLGSDPVFVAETGCSILRTLDESGVIAVPTGFPGGDLNRIGNSPAVLSVPRTSLDEQDLLPYRRAIEGGVAVMHVGNMLVPTIDRANVPASMSPAVMRDLLRHELGFEGVIVAGPMDSEDITRVYDASEAARDALAAGADMILWNSAGQRVMRTVDEIVVAIRAGAISQEVVDVALLRVLAMKERFALMTRGLPKPSDSDRFEKRRRYPRESYAIERRSITLVQNLDQALPLTKASSVPVGITGVAGVEELYKPLKKHLKHVTRQPIRTARHGGRIFDFEIDRVTRHVEGIRTVVCVLTGDLKSPGQIELIKAFKLKGIRVVVVRIGYPDNLAHLALADAIVLAYCNPEALGESMHAVADVLAGQGAVGILKAARDVRMTVGTTGTFSVLDVVRVPAGVLPVTVAPPFVAGVGVPYDPTYAIKKVVWDFGDGDRSKEPLAQKAYEAPGRYPVKLTVIDRIGETTEGTFHAVVE